MVSLAEDLKLALDRVSFARRWGSSPIRGKRTSSAPPPTGCS
jgi:hypothetical protein